MKICKVCSDEFSPGRSTQSFCSNRCKGLGQPRMSDETRKRIGETLKNKWLLNPETHPKFGKKLSVEHRAKLSVSASGRCGDKHPRWNGGKEITQSGYISVLKKDRPSAGRRGYIREHRLVMEEHIGRYLLPSEVVHHINGIKTDNRIENLELMARSEHCRHHAKERHQRQGRL